MFLYSDLILLEKYWVPEYSFDPLKQTAGGGETTGFPIQCFFACFFSYSQFREKYPTWGPSDLGNLRKKEPW